MLEELRSLLNRYSIDNELDIPDILLAEYLLDHIENLKKMNRKVNDWFGRRSS